MYFSIVGAEADIPRRQPYVHNFLHFTRAAQGKDGSNQVGFDVEQRSEARVVCHQPVPHPG